MRKFYSLILSFLMLPMTMVAQNEYCTLSGTTSRSDARGINSLTVSDGNSSVSVAGPGVGTRQALYLDQTATVLSTQAGATISVKNNGSGSWMHSYLYVDYNNNGTFEVEEANCRGAKVDGELVSHTGYSGIQTSAYNKPSDPTVYSDGTSIDYGTSYNCQMPSFTLPADLAPGDYRVRHKIDWNCVDPCGRTADNGYYNDYIDANGGGIIDFTIRIESSDYDQARTITVASANDAQGTVAITNPATEGKQVSTTQKSVTITATPAEGYAFLNWTDASGAVVSTEATYTYSGAEDASFTANFGFVLTFSVGENGTAAFYKGTELLQSGVVLAPGTEVTVSLSPATNKFAQVKVNGASVAVTANSCSFEMEKATDVVVSFVDAIYILSIEVIGDGEVQVYDGGTYKNGPSGNEYKDGDDITGKSLRAFFAPAEGAEFVSVKIVEGATTEDLTTKVQQVTAEGYEGWYFAALSRPADNRTLVVEFTEAAAEIEYCQPTGVDGRYYPNNKTARADRAVTSIDLSDGTNTASVEGAAAPAGATGTRAIVYDRTSTVFNTTAGSTVAVTVNGQGEWMNTFVYVDFDKTGLEVADRVYTNFTGGHTDVAHSFSFNVPADQAEGEYRVRYILDWENTDPCYYGQAQVTGNINDNGEYVIDFTLKVTDKTSGIDGIGIDPANGPVEYYNIQGMRVAAENLVPGFYVIRQGNKAAKVFINK